MTRYEQGQKKIRELKIKRLEHLEDADLRTFYSNAIEGMKIKLANMTLEDASRETDR